eukprot:1872753-Rhodomonas_salina.1
MVVTGAESEGARAGQSASVLLCNLRYNLRYCYAVRGTSATLCAALRRDVGGQAIGSGSGFATRSLDLREGRSDSDNPNQAEVKEEDAEQDAKIAEEERQTRAAAEAEQEAREAEEEARVRKEEAARKEEEQQEVRRKR